MRVVRSQVELSAMGIGPGGAARPIFVPTMGALHAGHIALVRHAVTLRGQTPPADAPVVVSVFVNPTQFNDPADLARYPRTLDADAAACRQAGADIVFAPAASEVYPPDRVIAVPPLPRVATEPGLEDALRPGHFAGVCQVVSRLFDLVRPSVAVFGEKDWQQLQVVLAMVEAAGPDAARPAIAGLPTVRESDGLAMSSRNVFLTPSERRNAVAVSRALRLAGRESTPAAGERRMVEVLTEAGLEIQYAVIRDAATLLPPASPARPCRALIAVRLGAVRLIDNAAWPTDRL
jgi:pantoate--beta-alanine ligase